MVAATPWNSSNNPNALVSFSSPTKSTITMDLNDAKHAGNGMEIGSILILKKCKLAFNKYRFLVLINRVILKNDGILMGT